MKASRFNFFIPYKGKFIAFNSFSQQFMVWQPMLKDLYDAASHEGTFDDLADYHPDFLTAMKALGFVVPDHDDELKKAMDLSHAIDNDESLFQMTINPTMNCNFKCWYCYESHIKGSKMGQENVDKVIKNINNVIATKPDLKHFHVSWFGGEPLLYLDQVIKPISDHLKAQCEERGIEHSISFTTNGYLANDSFIEWLKTTNVNSLQITLDGWGAKHDSVRYVNKNKGSYKEIVANIFNLLQNEFNVTVRINYDEKTLDDADKILEDFMAVPDDKKKFMKFAFRSVWQTKEPQSEKCEDIVTKYRQNGINAESLLSSVDGLRGSCYADKKNHVTINYNGELFKCTAREFTKDKSEGILSDDGELVWNERYEKRLNAKFKNSPCLNCSIMPICNGGCSQQALENSHHEYCVWDLAGVPKRDVVFYRFKKYIENKTYKLATKEDNVLLQQAIANAKIKQKQAEEAKEANQAEAVA